MTDNSIRLQKYLSECGISSRRGAEELIRAGKVKVNGRTASIGDKIDPKKDKVYVSGKRAVKEKKNVYLMLNKPRGYVTTMSDELGRKCVAELIKEENLRVYPVGRLDKDSEGLLLMTNDGEFANMIMHPSCHISKTYRVTVRQQVSDEQITKLCTGVVIDGRMTAPAEVHVIAKEANRNVLQIVLHEGRNRQIRKMCEEIGLDVIRLKRTNIGKVKLGMLKIGDYRPLNEQELAYLKRVARANGEQN